MLPTGKVSALWEYAFVPALDEMVKVCQCSGGGRYVPALRYFGDLRRLGVQPLRAWRTWARAGLTLFCAHRRNLDRLG